MEEKVRSLEVEVAELKRLRVEDAKANEKVVGIFATQEQNWIAEKRKLKLQIRALLSQFQLIEAKKEVEIAQLRSDLEEQERTIQNRDVELEKRSKRVSDLEEKLKFTEEERVEMERTHQSEAREHSAELLKQKTAFTELVSAHEKLEAEMGRVEERAEAVKLELDDAIEQKRTVEATAEKLSEELEKMQKDVEQKDKILSSMLRKSKIDTAEKQALVKELKVLKAKKRQVEMEAERWRVKMESRRKGGGIGHSIEPECSRDWKGESVHGRLEMRSRIRLLEYLDTDSRKEGERQSADDEEEVAIPAWFNPIANRENEELIVVDLRHLQEWVQSETEKYAIEIEQRHNSEIEAFAEQMRLKDEKMEVLRWKFLTAELEMKQLQSHIDGLDGNLAKIKEENAKLEAMLLAKEKEIKSVKDRFGLHLLTCRRNSNHQTSSTLPECKDFTVELCLRRRSKEKEKEAHVHPAKVSQKVAKKNHSNDELPVNLGQTQEQGGNCEQKMHVSTDVVTSLGGSRRASFEGKEILLQDATDGIMKRDQVRESEIEEEKEVIVDRGHTRLQRKLQQDRKIRRNPSESEPRQIINKQTTWRMDMQAMGVSYKLKRLKQQLVVLDKLAGKDLNQKPDCSDKRRTDEKRQPLKGLPLLMSMLNKQVNRYESLEEKTNDLCMRMHESEQDRRGKDPDGTGAKEETERLEHFLEETFHLQRYMVATGQKMMDVHSRITCSFISGEGRLEDCPGFNMGQFADIVRSLFRDVQRGLEVRIARIIGTLEGTLAREGILHMRM